MWDVSDNPRCQISDARRITLCAQWKGQLGRTHAHKGGGFRHASFVNHLTFESTGTRVLAHTGEHNARGTIINFCPWRGQSYAKANGYEACQQEDSSPSDGSSTDEPTTA